MTASSGPALPVPDGLVEAFRDYERAVAERDTAALARFVAPGASTLAGDPRGLLVGSDAITPPPRARGAWCRPTCRSPTPTTRWWWR